MKKNILYLFLMLHSFLFAQINIEEAADLMKKEFEINYITGESNPRDVEYLTIDYKNGFLFAGIKKAEPKIEDSFCDYCAKMAIFRNKDQTTLLAVTGYHYSFVCAGYPNYFFEISKDGKRIEQLESNIVLPTIDYSKFLQKETLAILKKYFEEVQKIEAIRERWKTLDDFIGLFYEYHLKIPQHGTDIEIRLTTCDITVELLDDDGLDINYKDVEKIMSGTNTLILKYNKSKKILEFK